jgi:membrane protein implicated in regulation of membrane protease activity
MRTRSLIPLAAFLVILALIAANWGPLSSTVSLNLLFTEVQAPLMVLLLFSIAVILCASLVALLLSASAWKRERRRLVADLDTARSIASKEEDSRTQALRAIVEREFVAVRGKLDHLLAGQSEFLGQNRDSSRETQEVSNPPTVIEPELVPPRGAPSRRRH